MRIGEIENSLSWLLLGLLLWPASIMFTCKLQQQTNNNIGEQLRSNYARYQPSYVCLH